MKHMTFRGSQVYTCLAILLEDFKINKEDRDIVLDMRMPYLFAKEQLSKTKVAFTAGTRLQHKVWFDLFLNHYDLEFIEEEITRLQSLTMLQNLGKFKRKALLSLMMDEKPIAVVFDHYDFKHNTYTFIMPEQLASPTYRYLELHEENLLPYLADHVHIGFINPSKERNSDIISAMKTSLEALDDYAVYVKAWCEKKHTKHRQLEGYEMVFRALLVDVRRMMKLKEENELHDLLNKLSHQYVKHLRNQDERYAIPMGDDIADAVLKYKTFVEEYYNHVKHTLKF